MSDLKILLPLKTEKALERIPKLRKEIEDPENQIELVTVQILAQQYFLTHSNPSLEGLINTIENKDKKLPPSQRRAITAAFKEVTKKREAVEAVLSNPKNRTDGKPDPLKVWKAVAYCNPEDDPRKIPSPGEITIVPGMFLIFGLKRREIAGENFEGSLAIMPFTNIKALNGFVIIQNYEPDFNRNMLRREHFLQEVGRYAGLLLAIIRRANIEDLMGDLNDFAIAQNSDAGTHKHLLEEWLKHEREHAIQKIVLDIIKKEEAIDGLLKHFMKHEYLARFYLPIRNDKEQDFYSQDYNFEPEQMEVLTEILDECVKEVLIITIRNEVAAHLTHNSSIRAIVHTLKKYYTKQFKSYFHVMEEEISTDIYSLETNNPAEAANIEKVKKLYHKILEGRLDKRIPEIIESYRQEVLELMSQGRNPKWIAVWLRNKVLDPDSLLTIESEAEKESNLLKVLLTHIRVWLRDLGDLPVGW